MSTPLIIERTYNAPKDLVWQALTDNKLMQQWYFDMQGFRPEVGCEFSFTGQGKDGTTYIHDCRILELVPGSKLVHSWRYRDMEGNSTVSFELFAEGNGTRLKLTHSGLETFTTANKDFGRSSFENGWNHILGTSLKDFSEKMARGTMISRLLNAPRELVWQVWTQPEHIAKWWGPEGFTITEGKMDVTPGGTWEFVMHGADGSSYTNRVEYLEVVPKEKLVWHHGAGPGRTEDDFHVTATFEEHDGKTRVTMRHLFASREVRDMLVEKVNAIERGKETLAKLAAYVENFKY